MNYTAKELLKELNIIWDMLSKDNPDTFHYLNQLLNTIQEEEEEVA